MNRFARVLVLLVLTVSPLIQAIPPDQKKLPIGLAPEEQGFREVSRPSQTPPPPAGVIHSLAEWEEAEAVMTLWPNASFLRELGKHGNVKLFADARSDQGWWQNFLTSNNIPQGPFSYLLAPTDSLWVRDYGPWFIIDGKKQFGIIDTKYNRPRPKDDLIPIFLAKELKVPYYQPGLTHTGGNYYNDGVGNAFSSTLVYTENKELTQDSVDQRMKDYLGIERYTTSPLAPKITIEHMDTFGKLVSPDTWVFSEFPSNSRYRSYSEKMVELLKTLKSPYGTPYRILRLKMIERGSSGREDYRAYINSFISNHALYFPTYGDSSDAYAAKVYQEALPGYDIVGVSNGNTEWGDSVHCRSRNLLQRNTIFIFPTVKTAGDANHPTVVEAEIIPSPGATLDQAPKLVWKANDTTTASPMKNTHDYIYEAEIPAQAEGTKVSFLVEAHDTSGKTKTAPRYPEMAIALNPRPPATLH